MQLKKIKVDDINPAVYNPRTIDDDQFNALVASIKKFGQVENLIVNKKDTVLISGHMRLEALKYLGKNHADCLVVDLNKKDEKKLNLTMNNKHNQGEWDDNMLNEVLQELMIEDDYEELALDKLEPLDLSDEDEKEETCKNCPLHCEE